MTTADVEKAQRPINILVCGWPASGNRLAIAQIKRSGGLAEHSHAEPANERVWPALIGWADGLLVPFRRDTEAQRASAAKVGGAGFCLKPGYFEQHSAKINAANLPTAWVCFEEVCNSGGAVLDQALTFLGLTPAPWPTAVSAEDWISGRVLTMAEKAAMPPRLIP